MNFQPIDASEPDFIKMLEGEGLPTEDLAGDSKCYFGHRDARGDLVAAGGLELCGSNAILRSCVVAPDQKGQGLGGQLIEAIINAARQRQLGQLFLLTETASGFFLKYGFQETDRDSVPDEIAVSAQFSEICPQSAVAMTLGLDAPPPQD
jgi:amino-acid N-acetyltransferase